MSEDIVAKAEALPEKPLSYEEWWDQSREMWPELVAEIKRLEQLIGRTASNFLQLQPGIAWEGGIDKAMKAAVGEIRRLRKEILAAMRSTDSVAIRVGDSNMFLYGSNESTGALQEYVLAQKKQLAAKDAEIAKWKQIAIKQHALIKFIETEERYAYSEHVVLSDRELEQAAEELGVPIHQDKTYKKIAIKHLAWAKFIEDELDAIPQEKNYEDYRERYEREAANDLNIQISRDANYLKRLEGFALSMAIEAGWDMEEARAALEKIRHGC